MDPETLAMSQGVPPFPLMLTWVGCYLLNLIILLGIAGILNWFLQKMLGWIITQTTSLTTSLGIILFLYSTFLIPGRMLPMNYLMPGSESLIHTFYWSSLMLLALAGLHLILMDIPRRVKTSIEKKSRKQKEPPKPWINHN